MSFSKREYEEFKASIDKIVYKYVRRDRSTITSLITHAVESGYDKKKLETKLKADLDKDVAFKLADKAFAALDALGIKVKASRKRTTKDELKDKESKRPKLEDERPVIEKPKEEIAPPIHLTPGQIQIQDLMAKAQATIEERKRALSMHGEVISKPTPPPLQEPTREDRIAALQARILAGIGSTQLEIPKPAAVPVLPKLPTFLQILQPTTEEQEDKPTSILLDAQGRTVDSSGKEVHMTLRVPTLKANLRVKKPRESKGQVTEKSGEETPENQFFDPRVSSKSFTRQRKDFRFHDQGKYVQLAQRERAKSRLERLQNQISFVAKKTGISSAAKLAQLEQREHRSSYLQTPDIEWWDVIILENDTYPIEGEPVKVKRDFITNLVEHPMEIKCPTDLDKKIELPVFLTKGEKKKLRRMTRREMMKEKQEKVRLGLEPPPEPKVRISNLMRTLGTEAVLDPTKMEKHVREQMAKRLKAHQDANAQRKLTPDQRKEKNIKKIKEDTSAGVQVAIYRVTDLSNGSHKFKVETNAKQLFLTGVVILFKEVNVIVVEGGPRQLSKYKRLMMTRIDWTQRARSCKDIGPEGRCHLIWEGSAADRSFHEFQFKACPTEEFAREHFRKHRVEQYWDLAYGSKVLEEAQGL